MAKLNSSSFSSFQRKRKEERNKQNWFQKYFPSRKRETRKSHLCFVYAIPGWVILNESDKLTPWFFFPANQVLQGSFLKVVTWTDFSFKVQTRYDDWKPNNSLKSWPQKEPQIEDKRHRQITNEPTATGKSAPDGIQFILTCLCCHLIPLGSCKFHFTFDYLVQPVKTLFEDSCRKYASRAADVLVHAAAVISYAASSNRTIATKLPCYSECWDEIAIFFVIQIFHFKQEKKLVAGIHVHFSKLVTNWEWCVESLSKDRLWALWAWSGFREMGQWQKRFGRFVIICFSK